MTVEQNIAFGLKQDKLPTAEIASRVNEMLGLVHMQEFAKRKPHQLSGGQRHQFSTYRFVGNANNDTALQKTGTGRRTGAVNNRRCV